MSMCPFDHFTKSFAIHSNWWVGRFCPLIFSSIYLSLLLLFLLLCLSVRKIYECVIWRRKTKIKIMTKWFFRAFRFRFLDIIVVVVIWIRKIFSIKFFENGDQSERSIGFHFDVKNSNGIFFCISIGIYSMNQMYTGQLIGEWSCCFLIFFLIFKSNSFVCE